MSRIAVVVLAYEQDSFIDECLDSVLAQEGVELEVLVADHGSSEDSRRRTERAASKRGLRFEALERQPTVARARTLAVARTEAPLVHTLDADNVLEPGGLAHLSELLEAAPPEVGFAYPRLRYFSRGQEWESPVPSYNLYALLRGNFCDTASLYRRDCFARGLPDVPFHEDWAFALALAERGIRGIAAERPTVRLRKHGFTRSQRAGGLPARLGLIADSAGGLFEPEEFRRIKARWAPALSVVGEAETLAAQTCADAELVDEPSAARGRFVLLAGAHAGELLAQPSLCEGVLRLLLAAPSTEGVLLAAAPGRYPFEPLARCEPGEVAAVVLGGEARLAPELLASRSLEACAQELLSRSAGVELRGWPALAAPDDGRLPGGAVAFPEDAGPERAELEFRLEAEPLLPGAVVGAAALEPPRAERWAPRDAVRLLRFLEPGQGRRRVGTPDRAQPGIVEGEIAQLWTRPLPGTVALRLTATGTLERSPSAAGAVGHAESRDLSGMDELVTGLDHAGLPFSGRAGEEALAEVTERLGFADPPDPHPIAPRRMPVLSGRVPLCRGAGEREHRYGHAGAPFCLLPDSTLRGTRPLAERLPPRPGPLARLRALPRWVLAPLRWRSFGGPRRRAELVRWRIRNSSAAGASGPGPDLRAFASPASGRVALLAARHPATGDLLLSVDPREPGQLGYGPAREVGWVESPPEAHPPPERRRWCSREGLA